MKKPQNNILYLATFPPRECGIATFTRDLTEAIHKRFHPVINPKILAINNDATDFYNYNENVIHQITATNIDDYINVAKRINTSDEVNLIHVQHEFGIFGGEWGNHLIPFFQVIEKPVIVTFHSVLPGPNRTLKHTVQFIVQNAEAVIVMNELSKRILIEEYGTEELKIYVIPHGIPKVAFSDGREEKQKLGLEGKIVLSTFGHLNRGKGIEYAIRALPKVIKRFPNTIYLIIGATHPVVRRQEGEAYRNFLKKEVGKFGLKNNVKFYNKYLSLEDIINYLKATDIYLSPTLDQKQSVSGTLSYALGCGKPAISTNSLYAQHIITPGKGIIVEPQDSKAIAKALLKLYREPKLLNQMARCAYAETRHMTWPNVALAHFDLYQKHIQLIPKEKLPPVTLRHMRRLTDEFGIVQFANYIKPNKRYGYSLDDNARAMIVAAMSGTPSQSEQALDLLRTYLSFIEFVQKPNGTFANLAARERIITEAESSEDTLGRAVWALCFVINQKVLPNHIRNRAKTIFRKAAPKIKRLKSPRAIAFAILGLYLYNQTYPKSPYQHIFRELAEKQLNYFKKTASQDWLWFENYLTYSNSKLPESLFYAYLATGENACLEAAEKSLRFLMGITFGKEYFSPIGQNGWYFRYGKRAYFDQQPEDTSSMVQTLLTAYEATKKEIYKKRAFQAFQWFLGKNHLNQLVYDEMTGGCYDGLGQNTPNLNQGAESTISYLLARLAIDKYVK